MNRTRCRGVGFVNTSCDINIDIDVPVSRLEHNCKYRLLLMSVRKVEWCKANCKAGKLLKKKEKETKDVLLYLLCLRNEEERHMSVISEVNRIE